MPTSARPALILLAALLASQGPASAGWQRFVVGVGRNAAIAVDANAGPHIVWLDDDDPQDLQLRHAFYSGGSGAIEVIDERDAGWEPSVAVDSSGRYHVAYRAENPETHESSFKYAYFDGAAWKIAVIDDDGRGSSIAVDASDQPHISYVHGSDLKYARFDGSNWQVETVPVVATGGVFDAAGTSLVLTPAGKAEIAFSDAALPRGLHLATDESGSWSVQDIGSGIQPSLFREASGDLHLVWIDESAAAVKYARFDGAQWSYETIASGPGDDPSIGVDAAGVPQVSFGLAGKGGEALMYARKDGSTWTVDRLFGRKTGIGTSLAIDPLGLPQIAAVRAYSYTLDIVYYFVLSKPDLVPQVSALSRAPVRRGEVLKATVTVANQGNDVARKETIAFYVSDDALLDAGDVAAGKPRRLQPIAAGAARDVKLEYVSAAPLSGKYLIAVVRPAAVADEIYVSNNTAVSQIP